MLLNGSPNKGNDDRQPKFDGGHVLALGEGLHSLAVYPFGVADYEVHLFFVGVGV